jgi:hypothetical protein
VSTRKCHACGEESSSTAWRSEYGRFLCEWCKTGDASNRRPITLKEQIIAALRVERLAADSASYWDGINGTREAHERAVARVDYLVSQVSGDAVEEEL